MSQRPRIAISGYYGFDNAGDEAVLSGLVRNLYECGEDIDRIVALSIAPGATSTAHGIAAVNRYRPADLLRTLRECELLLSGGGSLLQDVTSAHGIYYYLAVVRAAQLMGRRTMFVAQGIGPLLRPRSRRLVAAVANRLDAITVRDQPSAELLRQIGVRKPIEVTADPALLLGVPASPRAIVSRFGVALRPWDSGDLATTVGKACGDVLTNGEAALFSMQPAIDLPESERFRQAWNGASEEGRSFLYPSDAGLPALVREIAQCDLMIGMRLHALILAAACGIPSLALSYDPKVTAFMEATGQGDAVVPLPADRNFGGTLMRIWTDREERAEALRLRLPNLVTLAKRNGEIAVGLLN